MKRLLILSLVILVSACSMVREPQKPIETNPVVEKEVYPYGMTESEWNELSIKDKTRLRRDFYFYEKGNVKFVKPDLQIDGTPAYMH